jgi:glycyl-tRNA synthetase beta chain
MSLFIADRVETLVGIWGIGLLPTGEKDPFGLRRAALGLIGGFELLGARARLLKQPFNLRLDDLLQQAFRLFKSGVISPGAISAIIDFVYERYRNHLATVFDRNVIDAVIAVRPPLDEVVPRIRAVAEFGSLPEAASLAAANKRVLNIIKKNESIGYKFLPPNRGKMTEPAEKELMDAVDRIGPMAAKRFEDGDYSGNLMLLASIKNNVDRFFDEVMVMVDDEEVRNNRAALLQQLGLLMNRVADISKLAA